MRLNLFLQKAFDRSVSDHFVNVRDLLQTEHDVFEFASVVNVEMDMAVKDALVTLHGKATNVAAVKLGDDLGDLVEDTYLVKSLELDVCLEEHQVAHVPTGTKDAVAIGRLEMLGCRALHLVNGDAAIILNESHDWITRNRFATFRKLIVVLNAVFGK